MTILAFAFLMSASPSLNYNVAFMKQRYKPLKLKTVDKDDKSSYEKALSLFSWLYY